MLHSLTTKLDTLRFIIFRILTNKPIASSTIFHQRPHGITTDQSELKKRQANSINTIIKLKSLQQESSTELSEIKSLVQSIVMGLKTIIWCLSHYNKQDKADTASKILADEEILSIRNFFRFGVLNCRLFVFGQFETKELIDNFASAFTVLHAQVIKSVIGSQMDFIFDMILSCRQLVEVFQVLLANANASNIFGEILFHFLLTKLDHLDFCDNSSTTQNFEDEQFYEPVAGAIKAKSRLISKRDRAVIVLRLFKTVFGSIALFAGNGKNLIPKFGAFSLSILERASKARNPQHFFSLLRSFLRYTLGSSLSVDQNLCTQFRKYHILDRVLELKAYYQAQNAQLHSMLTEIIMLLPSSLKKKGDDLLWVAKILPVLAQALLSNYSDLASLSLRTLEHYLDTMKPAWLMTLLSQRPFLQSSIIGGICLHLKQAPNASGVRALRILGKLGGKNHILHKPSHLVLHKPIYLPTQYTLCQLELQVQMTHDEQILLDLDQSIQNVFELFTQLSMKHLSTHRDILQSVSSRRGSSTIESDILNNNVQNALVTRYRSLCFQFIASSLSALLLSKNSTIRIRQMISMVFAACAAEVPEAPKFLYVLCQLLAAEYTPDSLIFIAFIDTLDSGITKAANYALKAIFSTINLIKDEQTKDEFAQTIVQHVSQRLLQIEPSCLDTCRVLCAVLRDAPKWLTPHRVADETVASLLQALRIFGRDAPFFILNEIHQALLATISSNTTVTIIKQIIAGIRSDSNTIRLSCQAIFNEVFISSDDYINELINDLTCFLQKEDEILPLGDMVGIFDALSFLFMVTRRRDHDFITSVQEFLLQNLNRAMQLLDEEFDHDREDYAASVHLNILMLQARFKQVKPGIWFAVAFIRALDVYSIIHWPMHEQARVFGFLLKCLTMHDQAILTAASSALPRFCAKNNQNSVIDLSSFVQAIIDRISTTMIDALMRSVQAVFLIPSIAKKYTQLFVQKICTNLEINLSLLQNSAPQNSMQEIYALSAKLILLLTCIRLGQDDRFTIITKIVSFVITARRTLFANRSQDFTNSVSATCISSSTDVMDTARICSYNNISSQRDQLNYAANVIEKCPLQHALASFLASYPNESITFFLDRSRLVDAEYVFLFQTILSSPKTQSIALFLQSTFGIRQLLKAAFESPNNESLRVHALQILLILHSIQNNLFTQNNELVTLIRSLWRTKKEFCNKTFAWYDESYLLVLCLIHISRSHKNVAIIFELLATVDRGNPHDSIFLLEFYSDEIAALITVEQVEPLLLLFLRTWCNDKFCAEFKMLALRLIVIPVLGNALKQNYVNDDLLHLFVDVTLSTAGPVFDHYNDALRVELLKLTTILIESAGVQLADQKKDIIKFAWSHLKTEDSPSRLWAYVNVCHFIATYDTPPKIIIQVYVSLLRTFQPESRDLVRIGLDVVIPVLPDRLSPNEFIKAIKWTKKIMYEEGHTLAQLIHMWQVIVRHPWLFYEHRSQFLPHIVQSLNRLGLQPNCPVENRELAISLAELMINWEKGEKEKDNVPGNMIDMLVNFLVRLALFASDNKEIIVQKLAAKCLKLLEISLKRWPMASIRFSYFDKLIATSNIKSSSEFPYSARLLATCLGILSVTLLEKEPNPFFLENVTKIQELICPCFNVNDSEVQSRLCKVLTRLSEAYPPEVSPSLAWVVFYQRIKAVIEAKLAALLVKTRSIVLLATSRSGAFAASKQFTSLETQPNTPDYWGPVCENILATLKQISAICEYTPTYIINHANSILCVAQFALLLIPNKEVPSQKYATPTLALISNWGKSDLVNNTVDKKDTAKDINNSVLTLKTCLSLLASVVLTRHLPTLRRPFLALLFTCIQRTNFELVLFAVGILHRWLVACDSPLTQQEQYASLLVLSQVDHLPETLALQVHSSFIQAFQQINNSFSLTKISLENNKTYQMQLLAWGLLAPHAGIRRESFVRLFANLSENYALRTYEIMQFKWTPISARFWPIIVAEALVLSMDWNAPIIFTQQDEMITTSSNGVHKLLLEYCSNAGFLLRPLAELMHANVSLAHGLFESLVPNVFQAKIFANAQEWKFKWSSAFLQHFEKTPIKFRSVIDLFDKSYFDLPYKCDIQLNNLITGLEFRPWHDVFEYSLLPTFRYGLRLPLTRAPCTIPEALMNVVALLPNKFDTFEQPNQSQAKFVFLNLAEQLLYSNDANNIASDFLQLILNTLESIEEDEIHAYVFETFGTKKKLNGYVLERHGQIEAAQHFWFERIQSSIHTIHEKTDILKAQIYCNQWTKCARHLSQWSEVSTMFRSIGSGTKSKLLQLEAAANCRAWHDVRLLCSDAAPANKNLDLYDAKLILFRARLAVIDLDFDKSEKLCTQCIQVALSLWNTYPRLTPDSKIHNEVLHLFHELTEVHESGQLLQKQDPHDVQLIFQTWRQRLPSVYDELPLWENIFSWRESLFSLIQANRHDDSLWTKTMLARIARKQQLSDIVQNKLSSAESCADISSAASDDAFFLLREQILMYKAYPLTNKLKSQSKNILEQAMNTQTFNTQQRAELERIKANLFLGQKNLAEAHRAFSNATSMSQTSARAWYDWAILCGDPKHKYQSKDLEEQMRQYALTCHLAALEFGHEFSLISAMPRMLYILRQDSNPQLREILQARIDIVPTTSLIPWIPQLLDLIGIALDGSLVFALLEKIINLYPQSIYYSLRLLHRSKAGADTGRSQSRRKRSRSTNEDSLLKTNVNKLMALCRWKYSKIIAQIDLLCDGMVEYLQPQVHAKWLAVLHTLSQQVIDSYDSRVPLPSRITTLLKQMNQQINISLNFANTLEELVLSDAFHEAYRVCAYQAITSYARLPTSLCRLADSFSSVLLPCQFGNHLGGNLMEMNRIQTLSSRIRGSVNEEGFVVWTITMRADDGKNYHFDLIPNHGDYSTHQLNLFLDLCMQRSIKTKGLHLSASTHIQIGQNLRLQPSESSRLRLSDFVSSASIVAMRSSQILRMVRHSFHDSEPKIRAAIYNNECQAISADLVVGRIRHITADAQAFWYYRKALAKNLACVSFSDFLFCAQLRPASHFCLDIKNAAVSHLGQKPWTLEDPTFRLSRNIERVLQPLMLGSIFKPCLGALANAIDTEFHDPGNFLFPALSLVTTEKNQHLLDVCIRNVHSISPNCTDDENHLESGLTRLIEAALSPCSLAQCQPTWLPWL